MNTVEELNRIFYPDVRITWGIKEPFWPTTTPIPVGKTKRNNIIKANTFNPEIVGETYKRVKKTPDDYMFIPKNEDEGKFVEFVFRIFGLDAIYLIDKNEFIISHAVARKFISRVKEHHGSRMAELSKKNIKIIARMNENQE